MPITYPNRPLGNNSGNNSLAPLPSLGKNSAMKKAGRKAKHFETAEGKQIYGLAPKDKQGRFRVIATGQRFRASSEAEAVDKFYKLTKQPSTDLQKFFGGLAPLTDAQSDAIDGEEIKQFKNSEYSFPDAKAYYARVAADIIANPKLMAEKTGIEQLAYLTNLKPLEIPNLEDFRKLYKDEAKVTVGYRTAVLRAWDDFVAVTGIKALDDITPQKCVAYTKAVNARKQKPSYKAHTFKYVRTIVAFVKSEAIAMDYMQKLLGYMSLMKVNEDVKDAKPIPLTRDEWDKLYKAAEGFEKALILVMLNGGFHLGEALKLKWSEIKDGAIVTHRTKQGKIIRACYLWEETKAALAAIKNETEWLFISSWGSKFSKQGADKRWWDLCKKAGLDIMAKQLRQSAASAMINGGVNADQRKTLLGHSKGMEDYYVQVKPDATKAAVDAIYKAYMAKVDVKA